MTHPSLDPMCGVTACTVTIVFAESCHREAWLREMGFIPKASLPNHPENLDFERVKEHSTITFIAANTPFQYEEESCPAEPTQAQTEPTQAQTEPTQAQTEPTQAD